MQSSLSNVARLWSSHRGKAISVLAHGCLLFLVVGGVRHSNQIVPYRLPGTSSGVSTLTYFSPGSLQAITGDKPFRSKEKVTSKPTLNPAATAPKLEQSASAAAEQGIGSSAKSGLGEGDITIALQTFFPYPTPDLHGLAHGTKGDVVLNAVIDEHGKISQVTLLKGLGSPIDETVIATVQQWQYTPAMKNGVAVMSEQELHFHYERG